MSKNTPPKMARPRTASSGSRRTSTATRRGQSLSTAARASTGTTANVGKAWLVSVVAVGSIVAIAGGISVGYFVSPITETAKTEKASALDATYPINLQADDSGEEVPIPVDPLTTTSGLVRNTVMPAAGPVGIDSSACGRSEAYDPNLIRVRRNLGGGSRQATRLLSRKKRIINGSQASLTYFPWQVSLWISGQHTCGGCIIASNWILTAAHCTKPYPYPANWTVYAGYNLLEDMKYGIALTDVITHANFDQYSFKNDIALMRTESHLRMSNKISPICLPTMEEAVEVGKRCFISGWGAVKEGSGANPVLLNATVEIIDGEICNSSAWLGGLVTARVMICAGTESGEVDACQGDSGGPLSCPREDGSFALTGVVSWGIGCGVYRMPGVYTRISLYKNWILDNIENVDRKYR